MRGIRVLSGELGFGLVLLVSLHASAQGAAPAASAGFPAEPADAKEPSPPAADAQAPPAASATPPEVPPPPAPVTAPAASPTHSTAEDPPPEPITPAARTFHGPEGGFRTGYAIPMGRLTNAPNDEMSNVLSGQVPIMGELGWRPIPALFLGGFLGIAIGGVAGDVADICDTNGTDCLAISGHFGIQLQYHIIPAGIADPWLGYGIGLEILGLSQEDSEHSQNITLTGFEFAHFMGGVDFAVGRRFSLGPFVDFALGRYTHVSESFDDQRVLSQDLDDAPGHQWLTLGVRGVFYR